ncbi:MAG: acyl carrier protein [Rhodocyclaceae bacterium]|nr:acyl carrier protein [Rhodocyclaceae bacterium]MBX3669632.1 acyl carrier protein [Rhodocyclaceae bacterium]
MEKLVERKEELKAAVKEFILREFLPGEAAENLTDDVQLISGGILDSIATLKLVMYFEERYGITLEAHEVDREHLDTVHDIVELLAAKQ